MDQQKFEFVSERAQILAQSGASKQDTAAAAQAWLDAVAADKAVADAETEKLLDFLEGRPTTIDEALAFAEGPAAMIFGQEAAEAMLAHQRERKDAGAKFCDCDACAAASEILVEFGRVEL